MSEISYGVNLPKWVADSQNNEPSQAQNYLEGSSKRSLDLAVACVLLTYTWPAPSIFGLVNKLLYPHEPAFYFSKRVGKFGQEMLLPKIRSMKSSYDSEHTFDQVDKSRIEAYGKFLRRTGIDELPQLIQVLKGDQSVVGARILPQWEIDLRRQELPQDLFESWRELYLTNKPGLTGLAQILGNKSLSQYEKAFLEAYYYTHASLELDLNILFRTPTAAFIGKGVY